ncbi:Invasion associated locus B (IalB) protein [Methylobacterium pseudosasicola]|uniref:Invasion associated locus B (IalB) protein n=1 Tax=Methylobacterium pseudosasicola TaxID=582667 RepID=A0A1I4TPL7_9HYPH|nr:Invasion associated locus B (IalB) protein [Methylobacterium pseudosasicola]
MRPPRMSWRPGCACALLLGVGLLSAAQAQSPLRGSLTEELPSAALPYQVKPVDGAPVSPGIRRVLERFLTWTLICDESKGRQVCNIVQSIAAPDGNLVFSWSIAATASGEPVFVVRAPVTGVPARTVTLNFGGAATVIRLPDCDASLCVGFLPVDPTMMRQIRDKGTVKIHYWKTDGSPRVDISSSLDGLALAIKSLRRKSTAS